jgi:hypothetical protein
MVLLMGKLMRNQAEARWSQGEMKIPLPATFETFVVEARKRLKLP